MDIFYAVIIFMLGATLTSFYHVVGYRMPIHETINGRSYCDYCKKQLRAVDVIPIFGYLINGGKCHQCHQNIHKRHLILEILGGFIFMMSYLMYGFSIDFFVYVILLSVLMIESFSDVYHRIVIDRIWMIGLVLLVIIRIYEGSFLTYLLSSSILFTTLYIIALTASRVYKKEALGGGDVKLYLFIGFILPLYLGFLSLFIASLIGFIYGMIKIRSKNFELPLVPFIFIGVVASYVYGQEMIRLYLSLFGM